MPVDPALEALGRRAAVCRWWRGHVRIQYLSGQQHSATPDFSDPLTVGWLLALVRERWGPDAHLVQFETNVDDGEGGTKPAIWWALAIDPSGPLPIVTHRRSFFLAGSTEAEALLNALEVDRS